MSVGHLSIIVMHCCMHLHGLVSDVFDPQLCQYITYVTMDIITLLLTRYRITHWGQVTHICVIKPTTIGSDYGFSPGRCQAIIWTNAGILLIGPLRTNLSGILSEIHTFSLKKMHLKMSSGKWRPFCLGLNVITTAWQKIDIHGRYTLVNITCFHVQEILAKMTSP